MTAFYIPSGVERQRLKSMGLHGFVSTLMGVDVLSELEEAMFVELNGLAVNGSWDKRSRDDVLGILR